MQYTVLKQLMNLIVTCPKCVHKQRGGGKTRPDTVPKPLIRLNIMQIKLWHFLINVNNNMQKYQDDNLKAWFVNVLWIPMLQLMHQTKPGLSALSVQLYLMSSRVYLCCFEDEGITQPVHVSSLWQASAKSHVTGISKERYRKSFIKYASV